MKPLNSRGQQLADNLIRYREHEAQLIQTRRREEKVNIVGAGGALTAAYEQLRNAAENTEDHLLLQNAIKRFFKQLFLTRDESLIQRSGQELAVELTLAGYLPNDHLTTPQVETISDLARKYYAAHEVLLQQKISIDTVYHWTLDVLAVECEAVINDHLRDEMFVDFAYGQMDAIIDQSTVLGREAGDDYGAMLFIAIHQALLKSDVALIRRGLLRRYQVDVANTEKYTAFNQQIDRLLKSNTVDTLRRIVDRQGAPLRILRRMIDDKPETVELLPKREAFLNEYEKQVNLEYARTAERINRAIVRSVIFLIITKVLIGIAIEVPYDYLVHGGIIWLPLIINLLFPPLYMLALRATHRLPGSANTTALVDRIDTMLYGDTKSLASNRLQGKRYGMAFSVVYVLSGLAIFAGATYLLLKLQFSLVHIIIFFVFLSAASFLGFRLSRFIRELEVVKSAQSGMTFTRDLLYLPFVVVGQWMSDKYSRINIVTIILDMLIELPLKTLLRLVRQWNAFIDDRKDRI